LRFRISGCGRPADGASVRVDRRRIVRRGHLAVIALFTAAAGACAHEAREPPADPYVAKGVAAIDAWFDQLSVCAPAAELKSAVYSPDATFVEVHGSLTLTATPACTLNRCESECCNSCAPAWVVVPGSEGPTRELALVKSGQSSPMSASVKDCKLRAVREQIRKPQVIVSGWLESDPVQPKIIRASICVVKPPPATK
jgi:hypothetical protein